MVMALEHQEAPRYGIYETGTTRARFVDTCRGCALERRVFHCHYRARLAPTRYARPPFVIVIDPSFQQILKRFRLLQWVFWLLESTIESSNFVYLIGHSHAENDRIEIKDISEEAPGDAHNSAALAMMRSDMLDECLKDTADNCIKNF
jgi:hypothetical protein